MRVVVLVGFILLCLGGNGCSLLGKKKPNAAPRGPGESTWPPATGGTSTPAPGDRPAGAAALSGVLAGQVVDMSRPRPPATAIQVVSSAEAGGTKAAPIETLADVNGYFVIQGLKAGQPYELIARAKDGDRTLAGRVWVRPPDPKILIRISEELATSTTPPLPGPPQVPGQRPLTWGGATSPTTNPPAGSPQEQDWAPGRGLATDGRRPSDLGVPLRAEPGPGQPDTSAVPAPQPPAGAWPPNITSIPPQANRDSDPSPRPGPLETPAPSPLAGSGAPQATPVPSCMLVGDRLHNLALYDLTGRTWEFRQRTGKLVLLDFWYSTCIPCQHAIDHLKILQTRYGPALEVVGIAYETGNPREHAQKVRRVAERKGINYTLLLGTGQGVPCPVRDQFRVFRFPTVFLLGENGQLLKKYEGLDADNLRDLEILIQHYLGVAARN